MKTLKTIAYLCFLFACQNCLSQDARLKMTEVKEVKKATPFLSWERFTIRKSFESKTDDDDKAASLSLTIPRDNDDFFRINSGIGYTFAKLGELNYNELSIFYVYNKNNQIDKRQENQKAGLTHQLFYQTEGNLAFINDNTAEYLNDNTNKTESILVVSYLGFRNAKWRIGTYPTNENYIVGQFNPKIGWEYQYNFERETPLENGYQLRGYFNLGGNLLYKKRVTITTKQKIQQVDSTGKSVGEPTPGPDLIETTWRKGLELIVTYEGRSVLADTYDDNPTYLPLWKGELKYYPIKDNNLTVGVSFNKGEDPIAGLEKQEFWMLSLNFKK